MKDLNRLVSENKINVSYENGCCIATDCITFQKVYIKNISKVIIGLRTNSVPEDFLYIDKCLIMDENDTVIFNEQRFVDGKAYEKATDIQKMLSEVLKVNKDDIEIQE